MTMSPRQWAEFAVELGQWCGKPSPLSLPARAVIQNIALRRAAGGQPPGQAEWSAGLNLAERTLRRALHELVAHGLMEPFASHTGSRAPAYTLEVEVLRALFVGRAKLDPEAFEGADLPRYPGKFDGANAFEGADLPRYPGNSDGATRARGGNSSSSSSSSPSSPMTPQELAVTHNAMLGALNRHGFKLSPAMKDDIRSTWVGHFTLAEVEVAAVTADRANARRWDFIATVLENNRLEAGVVGIDTWRGGGAAL